MRDNFPLQELREQLEQASAADPDRKRFGADTHQYRWNPPISPEVVERFEEKIGVSLPAEYREFLLQAGNGGAGPFYGLFSLEQTEHWLQWEIEPEKPPLLSPDQSADDLDIEGENWRRGCIPIESEGDTYFTGLMVTGPDRGRIVYIDYEGSYVVFPREPGFLCWYQRWLREVRNHYDSCWFATNLDGDEQELREYYRQAQTEEDRLDALYSMEKFPAFSEDTVEFLKQILWERRDVEDAKPLLPLLHRASPELFDRFLEYRWEAGHCAAVVRELQYSLLHMEGEDARLVQTWWERVLEKLPLLSDEIRLTAVHILKMSQAVPLRQVAWVLNEETDARRKQEYLYDFARFPGAAEQPELWLELLEEREDLKLLHTAIITAPKAADGRLKESLSRIRSQFSFVQEKIPDLDKVDYNLRAEQERVYRSACEALDEIWHEEINPAVEGVPRPYRLQLNFHYTAELGLREPKPKNGIPLHPILALAVLHSVGRYDLIHRFHPLPFTAYGWRRALAKRRTLSLLLDDNTVGCRHERARTVDLRGPDEFPPPKPFYYSMEDWSAIGLMKNLKDLTISQICVEDFSFLPRCRSLERLSLYNTNFSDCRLLLELPRLKSVDLRLCRLEHTEVLEGAPFTYTLEDQPER